MRKLRVLLWDVDGTILNFLAAEKAAIRRGFEDFKLGECTDQMLAEYSAINKKYWERLERGEITKPEVLKGRFVEFFGKYGLPVETADAFNKAYQVNLGDTICFNDHAYELIASLRGMVRQYAASNGTRIAQEKKLTKSGLIELFDGVFISEIVGTEKPGKGFFDAAFDEIEKVTGPLAEDEVMIIGDSLTSDIRGGNNAGILTCWYNPEHKTNDQGVRVDYEIEDLNKIKELL